MFRVFGNRLFFRSLTPLAVVSPAGAASPVGVANPVSPTIPVCVEGPTLPIGVRQRQSNRGEFSFCEDITKIVRELNQKRLTPNFPDLPRSRLNTTHNKPLDLGPISRSYATNTKHINAVGKPAKNLAGGCYRTSTRISHAHAKAAAAAAAAATAAAEATPVQKAASASARPNNSNPKKTVSRMRTTRKHQS